MTAKHIDNHFEFAELNLRFTGNIDKMLVLIRRCVMMGYDSIVVNTDVESWGNDSENMMGGQHCAPPKKRKKLKCDRTIPAAPVIDASSIDASSLEVNGKRLRIFTRLTVTLSNTTDVASLMHSPEASHYDIIAVRLVSHDLLQTLSRKGDFFDIVTYEQTSTDIPWIFKSKVVQACVREGLTFEISYVEALKDSSMRRQVLLNGRKLLASIQSTRGIVLSSGASNMIDIRAPYDAANLMVLFGVQPVDARKFISANAKKVLLRASSKKNSVKGAAMVTSAKDIPTRFDKKSALQRILSVPEFRAELEYTDPS